MSEISVSKSMTMIFTDDHHESVLDFMPYYYSLDIDFNILCVILKYYAGKTATSYIDVIIVIIK